MIAQCSIRNYLSVGYTPHEATSHYQQRLIQFSDTLSQLPIVGSFHGVASMLLPFETRPFAGQSHVQFALLAVLECEQHAVSLWPVPLPPAALSPVLWQSYLSCNHPTLTPRQLRYSQFVLTSLSSQLTKWHHATANHKAERH